MGLCVGAQEKSVSGRGGARLGSGRPKLDVKRTMRQLRAFDDEWKIIQRFARVLKHGDRAACEAALERLENKTE